MTPDQRRRLEALKARLPGPSEISEIGDLMEFLYKDELDRVARALDRYLLPNGRFADIPMGPGNDLAELLALAWKRRATGGWSPWRSQ